MTGIVDLVASKAPLLKEQETVPLKAPAFAAREKVRL